MKKTLITLMSLASVACAATVTHTTMEPNSGWTTILNNGIAQAITTTGYQAGDAFSLEFTVTANHVYNNVKEGEQVIGYEYTGKTGESGPGFNNYQSGDILTLATFNVDEASKTWGIFTQAGMYVAMENTTKGDRVWVTPTSADGSTYTWSSTSTNPAEQLDAWVSLAPNCDLADGVNKEDEKAKPGIANLSVSIDVSSTGSIITLGMDNGVTAVIETAYVLDANQLSFTSKDIETSCVAFSANGKTVLIPEPATATLSLLALAGLAARRRRK